MERKIDVHPMQAAMLQALNSDALTAHETAKQKTEKFHAVLNALLIPHDVKPAVSIRLDSDAVVLVYEDSPLKLVEESA